MRQYAGPDHGGFAVEEVRDGVGAHDPAGLTTAEVLTSHRPVRQANELSLEAHRLADAVQDAVHLLGYTGVPPRRRLAPGS